MLLYKGAINIAIKSARQAGNVILRYINRLDSIPVTEKDRYDFVSEVDKAAEAEILRELKRSYPDHAILAEESGEYGKSRYQWVIDPLDGTHNYLRGFPHFCVSIALLDKGEPIIGVVFDPIRNELFTASRGDGAQLNDRRMRVSTRMEVSGALLATGFPFRQRRHMPAHLAMLTDFLEDAEDIRRTGSAALDLCYVACGRTDAYWELGLQPWDMAAGALIVREAGGACYDFRGGQDWYKSGSMLAANPKLAGAMVARLAPYVSNGM